MNAECAKAAGSAVTGLRVAVGFELPAAASVEPKTMEPAASPMPLDTVITSLGDSGVNVENACRMQGARAEHSFHGPPPQFDCMIRRPLALCTGRAFIGYMREKISICSTDIATGLRSTSHCTPSLQGGVVRLPM